MTSAVPEATNGRWAKVGVAVACVFALQVLLLFWFSDRSPLVVRRPRPAPVVRPGDRTETALLVEDPTLFVLPRLDSFSGPAWLKIPHREFQPEDEAEPPHLLRLPAADLGAAFARFMRTNPAPRFEIAEAPHPVVVGPDIPAATPINVRSTLRVEGDLARRRMLSSFELRSWPGSDLLADSVVELLVDARGNTVSAVLLAPSGNTNADPYAVHLARSARFEPLEPANSEPVGASRERLTVGRLVFRWQTLPLTNGTPASLTIP